MICSDSARFLTSKCNIIPLKHNNEWWFIKWWLKDAPPVCITWSAKHHIKVQTINANRWIVFYTQIDMLLDAKSEISRCWEIITPKLVLTNLKIRMWWTSPKGERLFTDGFAHRFALTFKPFSKISSAFAPRTVQCTAIFSLRRMPNDRTV